MTSNQERPLFYTKKGLAEVCGVNIATITRHAKAGTLRLNQAREKVPGLGIMFKAGLCERFISAMQAKHGKPKAGASEA